MLSLYTLYSIHNTKFDISLVDIHEIKSIQGNVNNNISAEY